VAKQQPDRLVDGVHPQLIRGGTGRGRPEQLPEQGVGGNDQAGARGFGRAVAGGEPFGERPSDSSTRVGWLPRMLRPVVWLIGTRLFATNAVRYRSPMVRKCCPHRGLHAAGLRGVSGER
jgi:hypothetical protein